MPIVMLLWLLLAAGHVIAAGPGLDQPAAAGDSFLPEALVLLAALVAGWLVFRLRWAGLARSPRRPRLFPPEICLALLLAMFVLGPVGAVLARRAFQIETSDEAGLPLTLTLADQARLAIGAYLCQAIVLAIYLWRLGRVKGPSPDARFGRIWAAILAAGAIVLVWPIAAAVGWIVALLVTWITGRQPDPIAHETLRAILDSPGDGWLVVMSALVVIATPVLEELLYRGLLQEALRGIGSGRWPAIAITSVIFAAMHWQNTAPHAVISLFVLSLGFGWAYERTGRLTASIVMHMLFNLGNLSLALLWLPDQPL
jgi:membrane protease YdiL (CAAX protease family)